MANEEYISEFQQCKNQFMEGNRFNFIITVLTQTVFSIVTMAISFLMMITIEAIEYKDNYRLKIAFILLGVILVSYVIFGNVQKVFRNRYLKKGLSEFKKFIFRKILEKNINEFSNSSIGKILNAFSNDLSSIELHYLDGSIQIIQQFIMFIIALIAMVYLNWILTVCVMLACLIPMFFSMTLGKNLVLKERTTSDAGESFVDQVKDLLNGFILIKSFKAEKEVLELFDKKNFSLEEAKRDRRDTNDAVILASTFSSILVISMVFTIGLFFAYKGLMSIGAIIAFVELSHYATGPLEKIFPLINNRKASLELIMKIAKVIECKEGNGDKMPLTEPELSIVIRDLSFSFNNEKNILKNINLNFEQGKSYAIVGSSGCGKSTLIQLLLGYYNDYSGTILMNGIELQDVNLDNLYNLVSIIQQNVFLFDSNIKDNITMYKSFEEGKITRAIQLAGLSDLVTEKGFDYHTGEGGRNLSGGEKQRISIARCLIRDTPVILMDEATAALDNNTAFEVENAILKLEGLTKIIVTHKLNRTIMEQYDQIVVLREGEIVELGSFQELMDQKKYFYSLYHVTGTV